MRVRRSGVLAGAGLVAAVVAATSIAWACTAWTGMYPLSEPAGPSGTEVTVRGTSPVAGPVEIRWDGLKGKVLGVTQAAAREQGGEFVADVKIPKAAPGVHYVVVVSSGQGGWSRAAFKIPGKAAPAVADLTPAGDRAEVNPLLTAEPLWSPPEPQATRSSNPAVMAGMVLLSVGMVAMVVSFGVAGIRRSRSRVTSDRA